MDHNGDRFDAWPSVTYEERPWARDADFLALIPKSSRRRILPTYEAAVPPAIAGRRLDLPRDMIDRLSETRASLVRFDAKQASRGFDLPALLLRSESAASSQIENLTSSIRNVAMAELSAKAPHNARLIAGNVAAMRKALELPDDLTIKGICDVHRVLMEPGGALFGGELRNEQVWVGGSGYSPHGAHFVPPHPGRVAACLEDLVAYAAQEGETPLVKAAVVHAQFETVHPFVDGNGRTGRTLLHRVLRREGVLQSSTLPISAGLLHDVDAYMDAIVAYQQGDPLPVIESVALALEQAVVLGEAAADRIAVVLAEWRGRMTERKGARIWDLPAVLVAQPVVNARYVAEHLAMTPRAANNLVDRACEYGILRPVGNAQRGVFYQADELIDVLEEVSDVRGIRRMLAGVARLRSP